LLGLLTNGKISCGIQVPAFFRHKEKKPYKESYATIRYYSVLGNISAFIFLLIEIKQSFNSKQGNLLATVTHHFRKTAIPGHEA
jgi:hypothetical protein